ncbi:PKD domain-containing protein [Flavobacterium cerinum]|uniref:PKD domain-containing protein n=1 Tax=Flavobacterium cerinum TaxID=2502784 RepID=A0ABY5IQ53_9FLAO|nr:PKD domain-containing protein [Flavobacterium cerinum]UUC44963.1 PKD domain-containing protein [Flavobacterium cerinum]
MKIKLLLLIFPFFAMAQTTPQMQWGTGGGSSDNGQIGLTERVEKMSTDTDGNVYFFSPVFRNDIRLGDQVIGEGHDAMHTDILLGSLDCNGQPRWAKIIGGNAGDTGKTIGVYQDKVYLTGSINRYSYPVNFGNDTILPASGFQSLFLSQYKTDGTLKWTKMIQSDTITGWSYSRTAIVDMDIDRTGNIYLLALFPPGSKLADTTIKIPDGSGQNRLYVLKYDGEGILQEVHQLNADFSQTNQYFIVDALFFKRHWDTGNYYISGSLVPPNTGAGSDVLYLGGQEINSKMYIACFNPEGEYLWHKKSQVLTQLNNTASECKISIDEDDGNLYFFGKGALGDSFDGFVFENPLGFNPSHVANFVIKMDRLGNRIWGKSGYAMPMCFTLGGSVNHNKVALGGVFATEMHWDDRSLSSNGQDGWFAILDKNNGNLEKLDRIEGNGFYDGITTMQFRRHDLLFGGYFANDLFIGNQTLTTIGGSSDFFLAKYGFSCDCRLPLAGFTSQVSGTNSNQVNFLNGSDFTGTTMHWDFGNGQTSSELHPSYTYAVPGSYTVCLEVTNNCGVDTTCKTITVGTLSVPDQNTVFPGLKIYPNPVADRIFIEGARPDMKVYGYTLTGQKVLEKSLSAGLNEVDVAFLSKGSYILKTIHVDGRTSQQKLIKL